MVLDVKAHVAKRSAAGWAMVHYVTAHVLCYSNKEVRRRLDHMHAVTAHVAKMSAAGWTVMQWLINVFVVLFFLRVFSGLLCQGLSASVCMP